MLWSVGFSILLLQRTYADEVGPGACERSHFAVETSLALQLRILNLELAVAENR